MWKPLTQLGQGTNTQERDTLLNVLPTQEARVKCPTALGSQGLPTPSDTACPGLNSAVVLAGIPQVQDHRTFS